MKKIYFLLLTTLISFSGFSQDLIITGLLDGPLTGGVPKVIELYVLNDIADLSTYGFGSANNGGGTDGIEFVLSGSATAGEFLYIATEVEGFTSFFGFAPDFTSGAAGINGDDAVELFGNVSADGTEGTVIDIFGEIDVDGTGQPWEHLDGWAYRVSGTGSDGSTFVLANWTFSGVDAMDNETTNATAAIPFPIGSFTFALSLDTAQAGHKGIKIYPNPVNTGMVYFSENVSYKLFDITGKQIHQAKEMNALDTNAFTPGIYIMVTDTGVNKKLIVK